MPLKEESRRAATLADRVRAQRRGQNLVIHNTCADAVSQRMHREFVGLELVMVIRELVPATVR
jgi:hypothetical protein